ncbi:MAG: septum formation protein Maf [Deltaproteobacteria bacterium]|nr:septum formation protein Maf [Deltaproteobacteria bacterium]
MKKLILASQSPRRRELLLEHGFQFEIIPSHTSETLDPKLTPDQNALVIAKQKALEVAQKREGVILAADTIVKIKNKTLGKPKDKMHAREMLEELSGQSHEVITAFVIHDSQTKKEISKIVSTKVTLKKLSPQFIEHYLTTHNPIDKAGAYAIQEDGDQFVEKIEGSLTNVVGLPIEEIKGALQKFGILPFDHNKRS